MIAVFLNEKDLKLTENDKKPKIFHFSKFLCNLVNFLTDFVDWNVKNGQQGANVFSSMLREDLNAVFQMNWN